MDIRTLLTLLFLTASIALAGCNDAGKTTPQKSTPAMLQACNLLTVSEIETITGAPFNRSPEKKEKKWPDLNSWMSMCSYFSDAKNMSIGVMIKPHGYQVHGSEAFALYEAELQEGLGAQYHLEPVEGIGEQAGWDNSTSQLTVIQGPFLAIFSGNPSKMEGTSALELNKKIAQKVLARLPQ